MEFWLILFSHDPVIVSKILIYLNCFKYELLQENPTQGRTNVTYAFFELKGL